MDLAKRPRLTQLIEDLFIKKEVSVSVLRLDEIHPHISGNKWYKLKYNLEEFKRQKKEYLLTFGGAYSNHIIATAAAGREYGIKTIGIIRGEELNENANPVLKFAAQCGMKLFFATRDEYMNMRETGRISDRIFSEIGEDYSRLYVLPEGGSNTLAIKGCADIVNNIPHDVKYICCACGTGATLAGISTGISEIQTAVGISVLNGASFLENDILRLNGGRKNFQLFHDYHYGGYAKSNPLLDSFCETFFKRHQIKIEPVYTGKLFFGLYDLVEKGYFSTGTKLVAIHSGGVGDWDNYKRL